MDVSLGCGNTCCRRTDGFSREQSQDGTEPRDLIATETTGEIKLAGAESHPGQPASKSIVDSALATDTLIHAEVLKGEVASLKQQLEELVAEGEELKRRNEEVSKDLIVKDSIIRNNDEELRQLRLDRPNKAPDGAESLQKEGTSPKTPQRERTGSGSPKSKGRNSAEFLEQNSSKGSLDQNSSKRSTSKEAVHTEETAYHMLPSRLNLKILRSSALGLSRPVQIGVFTIAFTGFLFVLVMSSPRLFAEDAEHENGRGDVLPIMKHTAFCMTCAGLIAFFVNLIQQPLILGYLLGGVLVGPYGLVIVPSHHEIIDLSSLGLVFLLFMVGLELDVMELLRMGKVVLVTGALQFPMCTGLHYIIFLGLTSAGLSFGEGKYPVLYPAMCCGISSTMIVVKQLSEQGDAGTKPGRLTIGILIFQDIWAIIVIAIQPNLAEPDPVTILKLFAWIAALIAIVLLYAKYIMPVMLATASKTVELMLVLSLAWCFFVGCIAILPFIGLPLELACLIAGVGLATFPYSNEFNGKIRYIRDFFITLFFVGLGMQIPNPDFMTIMSAVIIAVVVLIGRWIGIFLPVMLLGGGRRLASIATINLSEVSEFALVICSLGVGKGHVDSQTLTILIWTFSMLAILSSYCLKFNNRIYAIMSRTLTTLFRLQVTEGTAAHDEGHHEERGIVLLGFHRIAAMLIEEFEHKSPHLLKQLHVIDVNEDVKPQLAKRGVEFTYGDYSSDEVLHHAHHGEAHIVISTIPDFLLKGVTNMQLLRLAKQMWPKAYTVVTADNPQQAMELYTEGANYVLRSARLVAERLHGLLSDYSQQMGRSQLVNIADIFLGYKEEDNKQNLRSSSSQGLKSFASFVRC